MLKNLRLLRILAFVVVFGGLIVLATSLHGAAAVVVWVIWLVALLATAVFSLSAKPDLPYDDATKQVFAQWRAAHPDKRWGWVKQEVSDPTKRTSPQDPAVIGRLTTDPPVLRGGSGDRVAYMARAVVDGHDVLVVERGWYDSRYSRLRNKLTVVSADTPGLVQTVCFYRRSGYQAANWYRTMAFWRFGTGDVEFDARFRVDADNRAAARRLLSPDVTRFLCADPRTDRLGFTFQRGALNVWLMAEFDDADMIAPIIDLMMELYNRIPEPVWRGIG